MVYCNLNHYNNVHTWFIGASDLQEINLSYNRLHEFPSEEFSSNTRLMKLDVSYNDIQDVPPIEQLEVGWEHIFLDSLKLN